MKLNNRSFSLSIFSAAMLACAFVAGQACGAESSAEKQRQLIKVLQSDAQPGEKAIACKQLAIYGSEDAVPVLAPLLSNTELASWARIALEAIPGPAADNALREAMGKLQGRLLVGTINSIGFRRDAKAVEGLAAKLNNADADVVSAAAVALGRIGGDRADKALKGALAKSPTAARPAVAEGCIRCAERFLVDGQAAKAVKLYDTVRKAQVPKQKLLEATRGAILARQSRGLPLLVETLRSTDNAVFGIGLRTARELPGAQVTKALATEMGRLTAERQPLLLLALADRGDTTAMPTIVAAAGNGAKKLRITAIGILERLGNVSTVPVLLDGAIGDDSEVAQAAKTALTRLSGNDVDADLQARLSQPGAKSRAVLIWVAGQRGIEGALPVMVRSAEDADAGTRTAALQAIGTLGSEAQIADLVRIAQKNQNTQDRAEIETALRAISGRKGAACVPQLLTLAQSRDDALRTIALHALASAGGADALAAVKLAINDQKDTVQDEAVRTLSTWPNTWPEDSGAVEPLLALAQSGKKLSHQVLAIRGYLQYVQGDKKLNHNEKAAKIKELLPLVKRPEEKRLAISALQTIPNVEALDLLTTFASEPDVADDACSAIVDLTGKRNQGLSREQRQKALQLVAEKCGNDETKKKAQEQLKRIQ